MSKITEWRTYTDTPTAYPYFVREGFAPQPHQSVPLWTSLPVEKGDFKLAIFHCSIKIISRSVGRTATAASAYRSASKVIDDETGEVFDYTRKGGVAHSEIMLCANAPAEYTERQTLWNAVQKIEKQKKAQLCREIEIALPTELSRKDQIEVVREYIKKNFTSQGMIADWALHDKSDGNPHAHILLTMRPLKTNGEWGAKRKDSYVLDSFGNKIPVIDEQTGKQKIGARGRKMWERISVPSTDWNEPTKAEEWRKAWADICNEHLQGKTQIDHRSYARQGKKDLPTMHEGYVARQIAKRGGQSAIIDYNNAVRATNKAEKTIELSLKAIETEIEQLEQEIKSLKAQKGQEEQNARRNQINERIRKLRERAGATAHSNGGVTDKQRATSSTDTDTLIRQAEAVGASAKANVADTTTSRADREAERERQATLRSQQEAERSRAENERKRKIEENRRRNKHSL